MARKRSALPGSARQETTRRFFRREFDVDIVKEYERLKDVGVLTQEEFKDKHALGMAINEAGRNAYRVSIVYQKARKERELFKVEYARRKRELSRLALARVQAWMDATGTTKKQITVAMVEEEIAANEETRKEYLELKEREEELREIRNNLESLRDRWRDRQSALQSQASLLKAQKEVILGGDRK